MATKSITLRDLHITQNMWKIELVSIKKQVLFILEEIAYTLEQQHLLHDKVKKLQSIQNQYVGLNMRLEETIGDLYDFKFISERYQEDLQLSQSNNMLKLHMKYHQKMTLIITSFMRLRDQYRPLQFTVSTGSDTGAESFMTSA